MGRCSPAGQTSASSGIFVQARNYDPISDTATETDTLTPTSGSGHATVVSTATTFSDHVLWEYNVTNNSSTNLGDFSLSANAGATADVSNTVGWAYDGDDLGWTATGNTYLAPGQTVYFSFATLPYTSGPVAAGAGAFNGSLPGQPSRSLTSTPNRPY